MRYNDATAGPKAMYKLGEMSYFRSISIRLIF